MQTIKRSAAPVVAGIAGAGRSPLEKPPVRPGQSAPPLSTAMLIQPRRAGGRRHAAMTPLNEAGATMRVVVMSRPKAETAAWPVPASLRRGQRIGAARRRVRSAASQGAPTGAPAWPPASGRCELSSRRDLGGFPFHSRWEAPSLFARRRTDWRCHPIGSVRVLHLGGRQFDGDQRAAQVAGAQRQRPAHEIQLTPYERAAKAARGAATVVRRRVRSASFQDAPTGARAQVPAGRALRVVL